jgi:hypothetical protein
MVNVTIYSIHGSYDTMGHGFGTPRENIEIKPGWLPVSIYG